MATRLRPGSRLPVRADEQCPTTCPTRQTPDRLADRWTVVLIESLAGGAKRFGELTRRLRRTGLPSRTNTER